MLRPNTLLLLHVAPPQSLSIHAQAQHHIQDRWLITQSKLTAGAGASVGAPVSDDEDADGADAMDDIALEPVRVYADPDAMLKQGGLKKVAWMKKIWQTRWFVLKCNTLDYFSDAHLTNHKGTIEIKNIVGIVPVPNSNATKFQVRTVFPDRVYELLAEDATVAADWVSALVSAQLGLQDERMYRIRAAEVLISGAVRLLSPFFVPKVFRSPVMMDHCIWYTMPL
jgi:hypothetical protein